MKSELKDELLGYRLERAGVSVSLDVCRQLRRAETTLRRWYTDMCNGDIERTDDDDTFRVYGPERSMRYGIPDKETATRKRLAFLAKENEFSYYLQGDPRGAVLYVGKATPKLTSQTYHSRGVCCAI